MTSTFKQYQNLWKIQFSILYSALPLVDEYFSAFTSATSSYELASKTVESQPDDLWCFEAFFATEKPDIDFFSKSLNLLLGEALIGTIHLSQIEDKDWTSQWHENFQPIFCGKFFITNLTHAGSCPADNQKIIIESSMAFGTGEHSTTKGCIEAMEGLSSASFTKIMDIGTGTGILAIAAAKIWPKAEVIGSDIDEVAVSIAREHATINEVNIQFYTCDGLPSQKQKSDLIISNILATPLIDMAEGIKSCLKENGVIILSGFLDYQLPLVLEKYLKLGLKEVRAINKDGWITLTLNAPH